MLTVICASLMVTLVSPLRMPRGGEIETLDGVVEREVRVDEDKAPRVTGRCESDRWDEERDIGR